MIRASLLPEGDYRWHESNEHLIYDKETSQLKVTKESFTATFGIENTECIITPTSISWINAPYEYPHYNNILENQKV